MADNRPYWLRFMEEQDNVLAEFEPDISKIKDEVMMSSPVGYIARGDVEGLKQNWVDWATTPVKVNDEDLMNVGMDLVNPMSKFAGIVGSIGKAGKRMSRAEAEAMGLYHPISKNKLTKPFQEMTSTVEPLPNVKDVKIITPEDLYGGVGVAMKGDRANIGLLTNIDGTPLNQGILLQGGHRFMDQNPESIWASGAGRIKRYANQANEIAKTGKTPYSISVLSGHGALNFNTMTTDAYLQQIKNSDITQKTLKEFDKKVREKRPEWLGINHPEAINQLNKTGELRHAFNEIVEKKEFQEKGFPKAQFIDLDLNPDPRYKSNDVVRAAVGLVESMGYKARTKPFSLCASYAADKVC